MGDKRCKKLRWQRDILLFCLVVSLIAFAALYQKVQAQPPVTAASGLTSKHTTTAYVPPLPIQKMHLIGGFSASTIQSVMNASDDGVQTMFYYGNPPEQSSKIGKVLQALNMQEVDGFIASNLYYYECQRLRAMVPALDGLGSYCTPGSSPKFASEDAFLATIADHLKQARNNSLVIGYWVLDDWAPWDEGSARQLLVKIHALIQQYTPGRPAICGFGALLYPGAIPGWRDSTAANFSPQGCDAVGLYIYTEPVSSTTPPVPSSAYDWSMSKLLPVIFMSLQQRGWDITREPLIGIAQAFGGPITDANRYQAAPTAADMELQSRSFCEHGAIGLTFYGWSDSWFGPLTQTPMSSSEVGSGIRQGVSACQSIWNGK